ncbi:prolyl aminopeptidase [Sphingobium chungbukense]|uniref:Proline iminopeptidase n=1 Tax=Sphingobium chungbukense TaxID=56193 RepID=A0A0M3AMT9_9SPHN|nr:prolyl aminopeptidase [Sphingobium chungbukense]KKW91165.1 proline iminopeptidase [Sphingobium chungbukense]
MRQLYPQIEPHESGHLDVGDGHHIYYERCGTPGAKPAVFLHGGPGAGISPLHRRLFDPDRYDLILFDQRGCGRSRPHAEVDRNSSWHLVSDIERLRTSFGFERWLLLGGSWGSTLALAYAQAHPSHVTELVLRGIFLGDQASLDWFYSFGASEIFPDQWEAFCAAIPPEERHDLVAAYDRRLTTLEGAAQLRLARIWSQWEAATVSLLPDPARERSAQDPDHAIAVAKIEAHFFANKCWLRPGQLLEDAHLLADIPGTIVHGRYDICCSARNAWELHRRWARSRLHLVEGAGHVFSEPGITDRLIEATDQYAASWAGNRELMAKTN